MKNVSNGSQVYIKRVFTKLTYRLSDIIKDLLVYSWLKIGVSVGSIFRPAIFLRISQGQKSIKFQRRGRYFSSLSLPSFLEIGRRRDGQYPSCSGAFFILPAGATPEGRDLSTQKIHIKKEGTNLKPLQFLVDFGEEVSPCIDEEGGLFRHLYRQDVPIVEFRDI